MVLGRSAQFVEPFLPVLLLVELRATSELVAGVLVAAQLAATVGVAAAGPLMDRWGPVRVLRVALVGSAVTCTALAATPGPVVAVPAAILTLLQTHAQLQAEERSGLASCGPIRVGSSPVLNAPECCRTRLGVRLTPESWTRAVDHFEAA